VRDQGGVRLAKRHDALSIRKLRELGCTPEQVRLNGPLTSALGSDSSRVEVRTPRSDA
jgi:hypothetical protein